MPWAAMSSHLHTHTGEDKEPEEEEGTGQGRAVIRVAADECNETWRPR